MDPDKGFPAPQEPDQPHPGEELEPVIYPELEENIQTAIYMTTPTMAARIKQHSKFNREVSDAIANRYGTDMRNMDWEFNGQPIILNGNDNPKFNLNKWLKLMDSEEEVSQYVDLLNGGHRFTAISRFNVTLPLLYVSGVKPLAIRTMDTGRGRSWKAMLDIDGVLNSNILAKMIPLVHNYRVRGDWKGRKYSTSVLYDSLAQEGEVAEQVAARRNHACQGDLDSGLLAAIDLLCSEIDSDKAHEYCEGIKDGASLPKEHPAYMVREWLIRTKEDGYKQEKIAWLIIDGWNHFHAGEKWTKAKVPASKPTIQ